MRQIRETNDEVMGAARVADSLCNDAYDHAVCSSQVVCFVCNTVYIHVPTRIKYICTVQCYCAYLLQLGVKLELK